VKKFHPEEKTIIFALRFSKQIITRFNNISHEKDISTFQQEKKKQARIPRENVDFKWTQSAKIT